jgi:hypothetical protein
MSALPKVVPVSSHACPFCGVIAGGPHETQEGCIAALHDEIGRMRGILANLRPAGVRTADEPEDQSPAAIRLALD